MLNKVLLKEIQTLREKLERLNKNIQKVTSEYESKDEEYSARREENLKQGRRIVKIVNVQDAKLSDLDSEIEKLELKLKILLEELGELKIANKENGFELAKVKAEGIELKKTNEKNLEEMKENLQEAKEDLRDERNLELKLIQTHDAMMKNVTKNFQQKLDEAKKLWSDKYKTQKKKYKAIEEPLINKMRHLDSEINATEAAILMKPKEMEVLKAKNELLYKKLKKATGTSVYDESKMILRSLDDAIGYSENNPESINANLILGVLIAKANLQTLKYRSQSEVWTIALEQLIRRCDNIIKIKSFDVPLLKEKLWENAAGDLKIGVLKWSDDEFVLPKFESCQSIETYMMNGNPTDSDLCINELIMTRCNVSEVCWLSELNGDFHSGYKTSHRLLYFQVADKMNCEKLNPKRFSIIKAVKNKLCQKMLLEAKALSEELYFPLTQDLFMEHIALCGALEGHEEFALETWRHQVRDWQSSVGCFGQKMNLKTCATEMFLKHNNSIKTANGCDSHVTAVAISALSFFLRVTLSVVFK